MQESHFFGLFLVHQEVDGLALIAEFTLRVSDLRTDICQIPSWLRQGFIIFFILFIFSMNFVTTRQSPNEFGSALAVPQFPPTHQFLNQ